MLQQTTAQMQREMASRLTQRCSPACFSQRRLLSSSFSSSFNLSSNSPAAAALTLAPHHSTVLAAFLSSYTTQRRAFHSHSAPLLRPAPSSPTQSPSAAAATAAAPSDSADPDAAAAAAGADPDWPEPPPPVTSLSGGMIKGDLYPPSKLAALEKKHANLDFNALARHLHQTDVHFFDQEVPYIDQDFTIRPDFRLSHRLEGATRLKRLQEEEDKKIFRLLTHGYWVTQGQNVRVAAEGKVRSVWTMVVAGDKNGTASYGIGKGEDMIIAERRALEDLRRNLLFVPLFESRTISNEVVGKYGVTLARMWPRPRDRGITASVLPMYIFHCFGIFDITCKIHGRCLPHHQVKAIFEGLKQVKSLREEAIRRGVTAHRMFERGLYKPKHPTKAELTRRGQEVKDLINEVKAIAAHEKVLLDKGMLDHYPTFQYPVPDSNLKFKPGPHQALPELQLKELELQHCYVPKDYVKRKPHPPNSAQKHGPAPVLPDNKGTKTGQVLFKRRGLPTPRRHITERTDRVI